MIDNNNVFELLISFAISFWCCIASSGPIVAISLFFVSKRAGYGAGKTSSSVPSGPATVRNKYWKASVTQHSTKEEYDTDRDKMLSEMSGKSRPFNYIGDIE